MKLNTQYIGKFWNPTNIQDTILGVLEVTESGIFLKCYGIIHGTNYMINDLNFHPPFGVVNGESKDYQCLTLINLRLQNCSFIDDRKEVVYIVEYVLCGDSWITDLTSVCIGYGMVTYHAMDKFVDKSIISFGNYTKFEELSIHPKQVPSVLIESNNTTETYLYCRLHVSFSNKPVSDLVTGGFFWNTVFKKQISFAELLLYKESLNSFFAIVLSEHLMPKSFDLRIGETNVQLYSSNMLLDGIKVEKYSSIRNTAVTFKDLEEKSFSPFIKWMDNYESIAHSLNLYLDAVRNYSQLTPKNYFLNLFYANETLLRVMFPQKTKSNNVPKSIEDVIAKYKIASNDANKIRSKYNKKEAGTLDYFSEVIRIMPSLDAKLFKGEAQKYFKLVKNTRDKIVHQGGKTDKQVIETDAELRKASTRLRVLFQALCLYYMGFEGDAEKRVFKTPSNKILSSF